MITMPNIARYDYKRAHGWLARYYAQGRVIAQLFSDSRYDDDPVRSHRAGEIFLASLARSMMPRMRYRQGRGICLRQKRERNGTACWVYDVSYAQQGTRHTKTFRIHRYASQDAALAAAQLFRAAMERVMHNERVAHVLRQWSP